MAPIGVAVLGYGMSATVFHIPFLLSLKEDYTLVSVLERRATAEHSEVRRTLPGVKVVTTLQEVLDDPAVELVVISTINDTHYEYTKAILNAGKHVVCEKPITPTSGEAYELAELAKAKNLILAIFQSRRFDSDFLTVKALIDDGVFGELSEFQSNYDRYKNVPATAKLWKEQPLPGCGAAYDLGSHLIDQLLTLFGRPDSVTGLVRNSRTIGHPDVPDSFIAHLHYKPTGAPGRKLPLIATARGSILSLVSPQLRFTIKGTEASFVKFGLDTQEDQLKTGGASAVLKPDFGVEPEEIHGTLYTLKDPSHPVKVPSHKGNYISWFKNVAEAVRAGDQSHLFVTPEQAALTIEVIEIATKSSLEGRTIDF